LELRKISKQVDIDFKKVMNDEYTETDWKKDGRKINLNIKNLDNVKSQMKNKIDEEKLVNKEDTNIGKIEKYLQEVEDNIVPLTFKINEKTKYYNLEEENQISEEVNAPQGEMLIQDLANNKEVLDERRKNLEAIHQTSAKIKDMSDSMAKQLDEQGAILDDIEANVITAEDNAVKAKEEIKKADEMSRGNRKKYICLIIIVLVAIGAITAILLSLIL
jgi:t-SNARE complex subunit (syntaxin)